MRGVGRGARGVRGRGGRVVETVELFGDLVPRMKAHAKQGLLRHDLTADEETTLDPLHHRAREHRAAQ